MFTFKQQRICFLEETDAPVIHKTINYDLFKFHEENRRAGSNKQIAKQIAEIDLTPYVPIIVDENHYIIDGQNRFMACKEQGKPIYYVVMPSTYDSGEAIMSLNKAQASWRMSEFLHYYAVRNGGCWADLEQFDKSHSLGISNSMVIYTNGIIDSKMIRAGKATFEKSEKADAILAFIDSKECKMLKFRKTRPFVLAVKKAFEKYTPKELTKLRKKLLAIPMCANFEQYLIAFSNIIKR